MEQYTVTAESAAELAADLQPMSAIQGVRCVLLADRAGRIISSAGESFGTDVVALASLATADFNANEQLARLVGERGFRALVHRGENSSLHVEDAGGTAVVVVLFAPPAPPGLVRELSRRTAERVAGTIARMAERDRSQPRQRESLLAGADEEIDRLFDW